MRFGTVLEATLPVLEGSFVDFEVLYGFSVAVEAFLGPFCGPLGPLWGHRGGLPLFWKSLCVGTLLLQLVLSTGAFVPRVAFESLRGTRG